jgi:hypothetical protein
MDRSGRNKILGRIRRGRKPEEGNLKKAFGKKTEQGKQQVQTARIKAFL